MSAFGKTVWRTERPALAWEKMLSDHIPENGHLSRIYKEDSKLMIKRLSGLMILVQNNTDGVTYKQQKVISHSVKEGWESKTKTLADFCLLRPLPGSEIAVFLLCPHLEEGGRELPGASFPME